MIDVETVRRLLDYDPATGIFTWKPRGEKRDWDTRWSGKQTGTKCLGYLVISIYDRPYRAHRLAWLYVHGTWPNGGLDHINRDKADNRIANLRIATDSQNGANARRPRNNKSGFKGVYWFKPMRKWRAQIGINGKMQYLGDFDTPKAAHEAYMQAAAAMFGEFAYMGFLTRG